MLVERDGAQQRLIRHRMDNLQLTACGESELQTAQQPRRLKRLHDKHFPWTVSERTAQTTCADQLVC